MTGTNIGGHDRASSACISHTLDGTYERSCCGSGDPLLSDRRSEVRPQLLLTDGQCTHRASWHADSGCVTVYPEVTPKRV